MSADGAAASLVHEIREPAGEPQGALILNHGRGVDHYDLLPLLDAFDPQRRLLGICPGGPFTNIPPGGRHWYAVERVGYPDRETFEQGYATLGAFLGAELERRGIGWERTVMGGFSQGAVMSYALGLGRGRPRPAGILAMSGFVPTVEGWEADLESRRGLPVYITHGTLDPIITVDFGRAARDLLSAAGLDVVYRESEMRHTIDPRQIPEIADWVVRTIPAAAGTPEAR